VPRPGKAAVIAVLTVGLVALAVGAGLVAFVGVPVPFGWEQTEFQRAVAAAPAGTERLSWTDWGAVRREVRADVGAGSSVRQVREFLDKAYDADLTSTSALVQSAPVLQDAFGFSPASAEWELFSQSPDGAVITLRLPDDADYDALGDRLQSMGYRRPDSETGVWAGGPDVLSGISADLTPELGYLALLPDDHLLLASDEAGYLETAVAAAKDDFPRVEGMDAVVDAVGEPLAAATYSGDYACGALAMAHADAEDQSQAAELIASAGTVDPYLAFSMAAEPDGGVRVAMEFADGDQARTNADTRSVLAGGPAVGQGGSFADRFSVRAARADGATVVLDLRPVRGQSVLGDLSTGPLLFATC
jgi:hypothetical protein